MEDPKQLGEAVYEQAHNQPRTIITLKLKNTTLTHCSNHVVYLQPSVLRHKQLDNTVAGINLTYKLVLYCYLPALKKNKY